MNDQQYAPDALLNEAASLVHLLGGVGSKHLILIGGLVPPLLVPIAASAHVGSSDIDFCLSVALTEGATRDYYKSIEETIEPFFEPTPRNRFRWIKRRDAPGLRILVDFLAPEDHSDSLAVDGARQLDDQTAGTNTGLRLRPFPVRCGELIDLDAVTTTYERVDLLYPGPSGYAIESHPGSGSGDRDFETARNQAFARVNQVLERLEERIVWTPDEP